MLSHSVACCHALARPCCRGLFHRRVRHSPPRAPRELLHVVLSGSVRYAVLTRGKTLQFAGNPGTTFVLPRDTLDERRWRGPTTVSRLCSLQACGLTHRTKPHVSDIALTGNWSLTNQHIMAVLRAVTPEKSGGEIRALVIGRTSGRFRQETWRCIWSRNRVPLPDEPMGKRTIV